MEHLNLKMYFVLVHRCCLLAGKTHILHTDRVQCRWIGFSRVTNTVAALKSLSMARTASLTPSHQPSHCLGKHRLFNEGYTWWAQTGLVPNTVWVCVDRNANQWTYKTNTRISKKASPFLKPSLTGSYLTVQFTQLCPLVS